MKETGNNLVGASIKRREDLRLLTGRGCFIDDIKLEKMLIIRFLRSPYAHAKIKKIDVGDVQKSPGIIKILTGRDIVKFIKPLESRMKFPGLKPIKFYPLAVDKVTFEGEPVVAVLATNKYAADDALELVKVDYEPLPAIVNVEKALETKSPLLYEEWGDNILIHRKFSTGDIENSFKEADLVFKKRFRSHRRTNAPIETRGCLASYDPSMKSFKIWSATQKPHQLRTILSEIFDLPENKIRVITPDVGGGFGQKDHIYREDLATCYLSMVVSRPVKWIEERNENFNSSLHAREQIHDVEVAVKKDGTILGLKDRIISDVGVATNCPYSASAMSQVTAGGMLGPYRIQNYSYDLSCVVTNKCTYGSLRGFGQPVSTFVMQRISDLIARELGIDPAEIRMKNLIKSDEFPYRAATVFLFDSGSYVECLEKALKVVGYDNFRREQQELRQKGVYRGIGISSYNEGSGNTQYASTQIASAWEVATVRVEPDGKITVISGVCSTGQGHETTFAQLTAQELDVKFEDVNFFFGDTLVSPYGQGTFGSRSTVLGGSAIIGASRRIKEKVLDIAAYQLKTKPDELVIEDGKIYASNSPDRLINYRDVARHNVL
jgi:carbon-monoxide dehydrogenase large subunit